MPLPSGREFKGAKVQWGEKEEDWSEERCNYSKLQHSLLVFLKKCLDTEKYCQDKGIVEYWNVIKDSAFFICLNIPDFKR